MGLQELVVLAAVFAGVLGCQTTGSTVFRPATPYGLVNPSTLGTPTLGPTTMAAAPAAVAVASPAPAFTPPQPIALDAAEASLRAAMQAEQANSPACVDYYYQAVAQAWPHLGPQIAAAERARGWNLYHTGLAKLIGTGQRFYRLEPDRGLKVNTPAGGGFVAIEYGGFVWAPDDFTRLELANPDSDLQLRHAFIQDGLGVPLLAIRQRQADTEFIPKQAAFAATAILEPGANMVDGNGVMRAAYGSPDAAIPTIATLRLVDPARVDQTVIDGQSVPIARDLSSAVASSLSQTQESPAERMFRPATPNDYDGLRMLEPYQPGKIPIIFVHGLLSDRSTWSNLTNELRAIPWANARYQFWYFQYPTGEPFLRSALTLREQTRAAVQRCDPPGQDPALSQMVLIGHSMGGLISKLQVTYSSTTIWDAYANRPFNTMQGEPQYLDQVWRLFFFEPQPFVKRVVFIGTPHQGSAWGTRLVGQFASGMVQEPADRQQMLRSLVAANPGVFSPQLQQRIPTSLDLLEPGSPLLSAMARLDVADDVRLHSIVGMRQGRLGAPSDGVVPVASARHPGAVSEYFIDVRHGRLTQASDTLAEVTRILAEHLREAAPR